jgi:hypothetical protein
MQIITRIIMGWTWNMIFESHYADWFRAIIRRLEFNHFSGIQAGYDARSAKKTDRGRHKWNFKEMRFRIFNIFTEIRRTQEINCQAMEKLKSNKPNP